jgi:hypothetical protein
MTHAHAYLLTGESIDFIQHLCPNISRPLNFAPHFGQARIFGGRPLFAIA